ncbi:hypothetical protein AvCA_40250 [Azotobacter vinelandii CA]|uniref:Uncharacterized protein n=2 Tax=Azotobacter vinelandii TaxID=354 RepID=C1DE53_AZOVD|nr:hypothetical protein Avin_40250 [Azotobacter vinelandii DJ]AGK16085.1 hypothetical protein AvCA_40250 [Azotobacter vinelandii CA]AGK21744.1 hypothetical protein AvCA6_40250 [Azotobacter vinelandii CA6]
MAPCVVAGLGEGVPFPALAPSRTRPGLAPFAAATRLAEAGVDRSMVGTDRPSHPAAAPRSGRCIFRTLQVRALWFP